MLALVKSRTPTLCREALPPVINPLWGSDTDTDAQAVAHALTVLEWDQMAMVTVNDILLAAVGDFACQRGVGNVPRFASGMS